MVATRIDWVREHCQLLRAISAEFGRTRPFDGLTIGTGIHLEAKTVALLLTLRDGGARLISTGNLNTTQPDAVERLRAEGVTVAGEPTKDSRVHAGYLGEVLAAEPDLILDNGGGPVRQVPGPPVPGAAGRDRGDDLGPDAAQAAPGPAEPPGPGHQRQPDQAVRGERARCRAERGRILPPDDEPGYQRGAGHRVRLRSVRARRRGQLPRAHGQPGRWGTPSSRWT